MMVYGFILAVGVFLGLFIAPYTGLDEWMQRKITDRVITQLRDEGVIK